VTPDTVVRLIGERVSRFKAELGRRSTSTSTTSAIPMNTVANAQEHASREHHLATVKEGVLLELLVTRRILAVALGGIHYPAASNTLRLVGEAEHPAEAADRHDNDDDSNKFAFGMSPHPGPMLHNGECFLGGSRPSADRPRDAGHRWWTHAVREFRSVPRRRYWLRLAVAEVEDVDKGRRAGAATRNHMIFAIETSSWCAPNVRDNPPDNSKRSAAVGRSGSLRG